jgi:hypothetical protein
MRYVLDSNIALKWVLIEADSDKARRLRLDFQNQIHELLAPDVFPIVVTADDRLLRTLQPTVPFIVALGSLP